MSAAPVPTGGMNVPSVLTPGNSQLAIMQGGPQQNDSGTGFAYASLVTQMVDSAGVNVGGVDSLHNQFVTLRASNVATYAASITGLVPAASCSDLFTLTGAASKVMRIVRVEITATTTSATPVANDVVLLKRSTANSAGTATQPTVVPFDSSSAAASGVVNAYTANPTTGNLVGNLFVRKLVPQLATYTATDFPGPGVALWEFGHGIVQPPILRAATEVFAVNLNGASVTGTGSWDISIVWSEAAA